MQFMNQQNKQKNDQKYASKSLKLTFKKLFDKKTLNKKLRKANIICKVSLVKFRSIVNKVFITLQIQLK